jgi:hypothetical protein
MRLSTDADEQMLRPVAVRLEADDPERLEALRLLLRVAAASTKETTDREVADVGERLVADHLLLAWYVVIAGKIASAWAWSMAGDRDEAFPEALEIIERNVLRAIEDADPS